MKRLLKSGILLSLTFFCALILNISSQGQTITATVSGVVSDPNGAIVPGATVTATSIETGLSKNVVTNDDGRYTITFLQPGTYNLKVAKQGFADNSVPNIKLEIAQSASLDITLQVTGGEVKVDVDTESTSLLQTETSNLETTIESKLVEELPSSERNIFSFVTLVPGTIDSAAALGNPGSQIGSSGNRNFFDSNFAVNGGRASTNEVLLDGVTNTIGDFNGVTISPPQDAVREFKTISGVAPAEYGRTGGGVVTISSKAGTRNFHGAVYEYYQDGNLNANGWLNNRRLVRRINNSYRHQFGGAVGGPIYLLGFGEGNPFIDKLEKTFFFANYELRREKNPVTRLTTMPTAKMRTGDLSELLTGATRAGVTNADGSAALFGQIYNPYGALVNSRRPVFAGNNLSTLPVCTTAANRTAACLDPVALAILKYLPLPNREGLINNYVFSDNVTFNRDLVAGRIDHTVSDRQNFFVRFNYEKRLNANPNFLGSIATNTTVQKDSFLNVTANHAYNVTDNLINNFRYGYTRAHATQAAPSLGFDPGSLGFPSYLAANAGLLIFPTINIGTSGSIDTTIAAGELAPGQIGGAANDQPRDTHMLGNSLIWVRGNHNFRFGGEYRLYRFFPFQYTNSPVGTYQFTRSFTQGPVPTATVSPVEAAGSSLASFLLGLPSSISREVQVPITVYHHYGAAYFHDDWRVTPRLNLNLGLRWDFETPTASPQQLVTRFDPDQPSPLRGKLNLTNLDPAVAALTNLSNLSGLLTFPDGPQDETLYKRFAPRVGAAYSVNDKTTLRGGFGVFFLPIALEGASALGTSFTDSRTQSSQTAQVSSLTTFLGDPFPAGLRTATGNTLGSLTSLGSNLTNIFVPDSALSYNMQYNVVLQRELAKNLVLDVAYVGSSGRNLPSRNIELNQLSPKVLDYARTNASQPNSCGAVACSTLNPTSPVTAFLSFAVANPFAGLNTTYPSFNTQLTGATIARAHLLRAFPQYGASVFVLGPKIGISNYNALQVNLQKRFSNGYSFLTNYTWSKLLDTGGVGNGARFTDATNADDVFNFDEEYSYSTLDVPHRVTASFTYELPFGKGKWLGKNWNGITNFFLGGWQVSGTGVWQRGAPLTISNSQGYAVTGLATLQVSQVRPNRVSGVNGMAAGSFGDLVRQGLPVFNPAAFSPTDVTNYYFGNAARTYNDIRRDNYKNVDLSITKNFYFNEGKHKLQFRGEFLNAFNMVVFGTPVTSFGSATYGIVSTVGNRPRIIQLVGRFTF